MPPASHTELLDRAGLTCEVFSFSAQILCANSIAPSHISIKFNLSWPYLPPSCFFRNVLATPEYLCFHIHFRISFWKNKVGILIENAFSPWFWVGNIPKLLRRELEVFLLVRTDVAFL